MKKMAVLLASLGVLVVGSHFSSIYASTNTPPAWKGKAMSTYPQKGSLITDKETIVTDTLGLGHLAWSPDSKYFAVVVWLKDHKHFVWVYKAATKRRVHELAIELGSFDHGALTFSPDGQYLAVKTGEQVAIFETQNWQVIRDIKGSSEKDPFTAQGIESIAFSPDSKSIAVFYNSSVWWPKEESRRDSETERSLREKRHADGTAGTYWENLAKGKVIRDLGIVVAFIVASGQRSFVIAPPPSGPLISGSLIGNVNYTPDGKYLLTGFMESHRDKITDLKSKHQAFLQLRDSQTGETVKTIFPGITLNQISEIVPFKQSVALGTRLSIDNGFNKPDPIQLWDLESASKVLELAPIPGNVTAISFDLDGKLMVSAHANDIWLWNSETGQSIERIIPTHESMIDCAISPDGKYIAAPYYNNTIYLFSLRPR